ncbi:MAG: transposase [Atopobiaceae bacterium]|nr:transposase [Atopobiaceae bacterium]
MANRYTDEYRREAVDYVLNSEGKSIKECTTELGINDKTLSHWVSKFKREGRTGSGMSDGNKELARLKRENERLRMENEFLKKQAPSSPGTKRRGTLPPHGGRERKLPGQDDDPAAGGEQAGLLPVAL